MCDKFDLHSNQVLKNPTTFLHQLSPINWLTRKVLIGQTSPDPVQITDHNPITTEFGSIYKYRETRWAPTWYQLEVICIQKCLQNSSTSCEESNQCYDCVSIWVVKNHLPLTFSAKIRNLSRSSILWGNKSKGSFSNNCKL